MLIGSSIYREDCENTLRILVATDCHLGYMEKDEVRRLDSFQAFEEICSIAEQQQVRTRVPLHPSMVFLFVKAISEAR